MSDENWDDDLVGNYSTSYGYSSSNIRQGESSNSQGCRNNEDQHRRNDHRGNFQRRYSPGRRGGTTRGGASDRRSTLNEDGYNSPRAAGRRSSPSQRGSRYSGSGRVNLQTFGREDDWDQENGDKSQSQGSGDYSGRPLRGHNRGRWQRSPSQGESEERLERGRTGYEGRGGSRGNRGRGRSTSGERHTPWGTDPGYGRLVSPEGSGRGSPRSRGSKQNGHHSADSHEARSRQTDGQVTRGGYKSRGRASPDSQGSDGRGRGRTRGGRSAPNFTEKKPSERYIPPELDDDEESKFSSGITCGVNFNKYDSIGVEVSGEEVPSAISEFSTAGLRPLLLENVIKAGYTRPTPVQKYSLPIVSRRRDIMACAQTGSGKTAAFLLPVINELLSWKGDLILGSCCQPLAIILSPTHELARQILQEARKFSHRSFLKVHILYGGTDINHQRNQLSMGCHILVATPGRLNGLVNEGKVSFASVEFFILDEADRMLDQGFMPDVEKMLNHPTMVPKGKRTTLMYSATFPRAIQRLASLHLYDYIFVTVGIIGGACSDVVQQFHVVDKFEKRIKLIELLSQRADPKELTLVFVALKRTADFLAVYICENDFPTTSIHGDRYQSQREAALRDFQSGEMPTLIATAVAARGLDIKNVSHVINYDLPGTIDEYVHRIGRTGRVGNCGKATSFYDPSTDRHLAASLVTILRQADQKVPEFLLKEMQGQTDSYTSQAASTDIRIQGEDAAAGEESWD